MSPGAPVVLPSVLVVPRAVAVAPRRMPPVGRVAVVADAQLHPVALEHEALEDDVAGLGGGGDEEEGSEEEGGQARHGARSSVEARAGVPASSMSGGTCPRRGGGVA